MNIIEFILRRIKPIHCGKIKSTPPLTSPGAIAAIIIAGVAATPPTHADTVVKILDQKRTPPSYAVYMGSLYLSGDGKLFRVVSVDGEPQELSIPSADSFSLDTAFEVFDNSLFIINGGALYRIDNPSGEPESVQVPASPIYQWIDPRPGSEQNIHPHGEFGQLNGSLYFLAEATAPTCGFTEVTNVLFRIDSAYSTPVQLNFTSNVCGRLSTSPVLEGTRHGLIFSELLGDPRSAVTNLLGWIKQPQVYDGNAVDGNYYKTFDGIWYEMFYFDEHIFLGYVKESTQVAPGVGETELLRLNPSNSETLAYEINPLRAETGNAVDFQDALSQPRYFSASNNVLYFQASADGANRELYRLTSADAQPQAVLLNPNGESGAIPFGEYLNRLWFAADTGSGFDIHYLADDGITAVPLGVDEAIARSARNFTQYNDQIVFSATTASSGGAWDPKARWNTYVISIDRNQPCSSPDCSCGKSGPSKKSPCRNRLDSRLTLNNGIYEKQPGLVTRVGSRINVRCETTNHSGQRVNLMRIAINDHRLTRNGVKSNAVGVCKRKVVAPGQTVRCKRTIRARSGSHRYSCVASAVTPFKRRISTRAQAMARTQR